MHYEILLHSKLLTQEHSFTILLLYKEIILALLKTNGLFIFRRILREETAHNEEDQHRLFIHFGFKLKL